MSLQTEKQELLTRRELADRCRVHRKTVARWQREGRIRALYIGPRSIRYRLADVEALLTDSEGGDR